MAKRRIEKTVMESVQKYSDEVKKHFNVDVIILFGSYAKGTFHEDSDIDVAIVSPDIKNTFYDDLELMKLRRKIDLRIEPHSISTEDFLKKETPFINEVINTGIQIYSAT